MNLSLFRSKSVFAKILYVFAVVAFLGLAMLSAVPHEHREDDPESHHANECYLCKLQQSFAVILWAVLLLLVLKAPCEKFVLPNFTPKLYFFLPSLAGRAPPLAC